MNILAIRIYDDVLEHILDGAIDGLIGLGHNVRITEPSLLKEEIEAFRPDFLFTINHIGLRREIRDLLSRFRLPYVSWWVDNPIPLLSHGFQSHNCILFVWDRYYVPILKIGGFSRVYHLPLATNPRIFKKMELKEEDIKRFSCNLSFVGGAFYNGFKLYDRYRKRDDKRLIEIIDETLSLYSKNPCLDPVEIFNQIKERKGYPEGLDKGSLIVDLEMMASSIYRKSIIEGVMDLGLRVYGDPNWGTILDKGGYLGPIGYGADLSALYNASKINLNITKPQLKTTVNQRVFDVSACGGFLLSDFRIDLGRLFELDKEIVFYKDLEDLREKILYFLSNQKERERIAERAMKRVLMEHTYLHRMRDLVRSIEDIL